MDYSGWPATGTRYTGEEERCPSHIIRIGCTVNVDLPVYLIAQSQSIKSANNHLIVGVDLLTEMENVRFSIIVSAFGLTNSGLTKTALRYGDLSVCCCGRM